MNTALLEILSVQLRLLDELYKTLERETQELGNICLEAMAGTNLEKEKLIGQIETHSAVLRKAVATSGSDLGLAPDATLADVAATSRQKDIAHLYNELLAAVQRVQSRAAMNHKIAVNFEVTTGSTLNFLGRLINQSSMYGASGSYLQGASGAVMINRKA
ncbi:MAG: flagellar protein FlgN [Oryzomonas sp.]|uniref:flagellar protein FlgN n=1 Tax=Oryzomonas sp. TaxID=2855186 RepID=UPI002840CEEA|nr:flagellar protein FlgN [Oryzomonas sp.]MDR3579099.1 flagellar protein FlgN [Oryzomonas sp.]